MILTQLVTVSTKSFLVVFRRRGWNIKRPYAFKKQ
jgi:hypothetical protein